MKENNVMVMEKELTEEMVEWTEKENERSLDLERQLMELTYGMESERYTEEEAYWHQYGMHIEG